MSKPPLSVCGALSVILKGTFMKIYIKSNKSMSYTEVKNLYSERNDFIKNIHFIARKC